MTIGRIIDRFKTPVTVERRGPKTLGSDGLFTGPVATTLTSLSVSLQPMNGDEQQLLPEGLRTTEVVKIYSRDELRVADAPNGVQSDRVVYKGETYEVFDIQDWNDHGKFFKVLAKKIAQ